MFNPAHLVANALAEDLAGNYRDMYGDRVSDSAFEIVRLVLPRKAFGFEGFSRRFDLTSGPAEEVEPAPFFARNRSPSRYRCISLGRARLTNSEAQFQKRLLLPSLDGFLTKRETA